MANKLFYYTRKETIQPKEGETEVKFKEFRDAINLNKVIRILQLEDDRVLILMDDLHQRPQEIPIKNKQGRITSYKREINIFQSEIYLEKEDAKRFYKLTNIEE